MAEEFPPVEVRPAASFGTIPKNIRHRILQIHLDGDGETDQETGAPLDAEDQTAYFVSARQLAQVSSTFMDDVQFLLLGKHRQAKWHLDGDLADVRRRSRELLDTDHENPQWEENLSVLLFDCGRVDKCRTWLEKLEGENRKLQMRRLFFAIVRQLGREPFDALHSILTTWATKCGRFEGRRNFLIRGVFDLDRRMVDMKVPLVPGDHLNLENLAEWHELRRGDEEQGTVLTARDEIQSLRNRYIEDYNKMESKMRRNEQDFQELWRMYTTADEDRRQVAVQLEDLQKRSSEEQAVLQVKCAKEKQCRRHVSAQLQDLQQKHHSEQTAHHLTITELDALKQKHSSKQAAHRLAITELDNLKQKHSAEQATQRRTITELDTLKQTHDKLTRKLFDVQERRQKLSSQRDEFEARFTTEQAKSRQATVQLEELKRKHDSDQARHLRQHDSDQAKLQRATNRVQDLELLSKDAQEKLKRLTTGRVVR